MKCTKCGELLEKDVNFCGNCGQPVEKIEEAVVEEVETSKDLEEKKVSDGDLVDEEEKQISEDTVVRGLKIEEGEEDPEGSEIQPVEDVEDEEEILDEDLEVEDYYEEDELDATRVIDPIDDYLDEDDGYYEDDEYEEDEGFLDKLARNKGLVIGVLALVIGLIVFVMARGGSGSAAKEELITDFIEALAARDASDVRKMLESPIPDLKIDNAGVEALFEYIDENPSFIEQTKTELERQSKFYDDSKNDDIGEITSNVMLRKKSKNEYFLEITPYYMDIKVGAEGTKIFIEGKEVAKADRDDYSKEFGPFMPGIYKIGGKYDADYAELETEKLVELIDERPDSSKQIKEFHLEMEVSFITIITEHTDARIILNGEKTDQRVSDLDQGKLGPVDGNTRVKLVAETPFGEFESEEFIVGESGDAIEIEISITDDRVKEEVMSSVNKFIEDDLKAKEKLSMDSYTNLINPEKDKIKALIDEMISEGYKIESNLKKISYDLDGITVTKHEGKYFAGVDVNYEVTETYLWEFTTETNEESRNLNVYLRFNESSKKWEVFEIESSNSFDRSNMKEFNY